MFIRLNNLVNKRQSESVIQLDKQNLSQNTIRVDEASKEKQR